MNKLTKILRFIGVYGVRRTLFKVVGRTDNKLLLAFLKLLYIRSYKTTVSFIGCGQFASATAGAMLTKNRIGIVNNFDSDAKKAQKFSRLYNSKSLPSVKAYDELAKVVYIMSNHASHTDYACDMLSHGHDVHIEKPTSVNWEQLQQLVQTIKQTPNVRTFVGYNRPHSSAVKFLRKHLDEFDTPFSLSCYISGHILDVDHWYRKPEEGTRVCGNLGHWLDLFIHILFWRKQPIKQLELKIAYSDKNNPDDNLVVTLVSDYNDLCSIMLSARSEPFEGINETINFQQGDVIAKIDDFRSCLLWKNAIKIKEKYRLKDVGHEASIMQAFTSNLDWQRRLHEVSYSNILMLTIKDMVLAKQGALTLDFSKYEDLLL